ISPLIQEQKQEQLQCSHSPENRCIYVPWQIIDKSGLFRDHSTLFLRYEFFEEQDAGLSAFTPTGNTCRAFCSRVPSHPVEFPLTVKDALPTRPGQKDTIGGPADFF